MYAVTKTWSGQEDLNFRSADSKSAGDGQTPLCPVKKQKPQSLSSGAGILHYWIFQLPEHTPAIRIVNLRHRVLLRFEFGCMYHARLWYFFRVYE